MFKWLKKWFAPKKGNKMINQDLSDITRGLQHAAATTNSMVAEQYIRILAQFFETMEDGTLKAKMARVQINDEFYALVPLVSMVSPSGLSLDKMKVELSIKIEKAEEKRASILDMIHDQRYGAEASESTRSAFGVSMSPRSRSSDGKRRPSDHMDIVLEFVARETPESVMRVIETYTNLIQPIKIPEGGLPPMDIINLKTGGTSQAAAQPVTPNPAPETMTAASSEPSSSELPATATEEAPVITPPEGGDPEKPSDL